MASWQPLMAQLETIKVRIFCLKYTVSGLQTTFVVAGGVTGVVMVTIGLTGLVGFKSTRIVPVGYEPIIHFFTIVSSQDVNELVAEGMGEYPGKCIMEPYNFPFLT